MPQFSENDINEAKRRVWEMRNRASHFVDDRQEAPPKDEEKQQKTPPKQSEPPKPEPPKPDSEKEDLPQDKSFFVILAMLMLLSKEGADNTLILALLYLLL